MKKDRELQLLVCSANLGNEKPDDESLAAWIPEDGRCTEVLNEQKYPVLRTIVKDKATAANGDGGTTAAAGVNDAAFEDYDSTDQFDIIVIGMQESTFEAPEDVEIGKTIHLSVPVVQPIVKRSYKGLKKAVSSVSSLTTTRDFTKKRRPFLVKPVEWDNGAVALHGMLEARLPSYEHIVSFQRGEMRLEVFCSNQIDVQILRVSAQNTGRGGLANKGGIVTELLINGTTRLSFLTSHLEAHEGSAKYAMRCNSLASILGGTGETSLDDVSLTSHFVFVLGDLNFRTELEGSADMPEEDHKAKVRDLVAKQDWRTLNEADELQRALRQKDCMVGFHTLFCNFPPTFKVDRQPGYSYIEKRRPSYTDRILWKAGHELDGCVRALAYEPIDMFSSSDHKPIRAAFGVDLNVPYQLRPRLSRRKSVMNFAKPRKTNERDGVQGIKERLQLFVSNIRVLVNRNEYGSDSPPNPYLCLISFPESALRQKVSRWKQVTGRLFMQSIEWSLQADGSVARHASGWPRTSRKMGTYEPEWSEEEDIHCEIITHEHDGSSKDLTGAMLRMTVMDYRNTGDDTVLGTFSFNLVNLLRECKRNREEAKQRASGQSSKIPTTNGDSVPRPSSSSRRNEGLLRGSSMFGLGLKVRKSDPELLEHSEADEDPLEGVKIDEPLFKNGRESGRIQCELEAWFIGEATANMLLRSPSPANTAGSKSMRHLFAKRQETEKRRFHRRDHISAGWHD